MAGWIKVYRDLADHWLAKHPEKLGWWVLLLLEVEHEDRKMLVGNQLLEVKRGQVVASLSYLAELWQTSKKTADRFVTLLIEDQMLTRSVTRNISVLTICNYDSYQDKKTEVRHDIRHEADTRLTRQVSETKNIKEDKEYISKTTTAHTHTYIREDEYIRRYREEGMWTDVCMILHLKSVSECESLFDRWILEFQHKGQTHRDYTDFKGHFIQWARITIQKERNDGNNSRTNQRRGVQVVANSPEDYQGTF